MGSLLLIIFTPDSLLAPTKRARDDPGIAIGGMRAAHWIGLNCFWIINCRFDVGMPPTAREGSLLRHRLEPPAWRSSLRRRSSLLNYCNVDRGSPIEQPTGFTTVDSRSRLKAIARSELLRHANKFVKSVRLLCLICKKSSAPRKKKVDETYVRATEAMQIGRLKRIFEINAISWENRTRVTLDGVIKRDLIPFPTIATSQR